MMNYLHDNIDRDSNNVLAAYDELPLWSAPFGLDLLDTVRYAKNLVVLDIGSGTGFPILELAQRLGSSSRLYALDPWQAAMNRAREKMTEYGVTNVEFIYGRAEEMPFPNNFFDLIVSNNGLNNVTDISTSIKQIGRVSKTGGQLVFTFNANNTMESFYAIFGRILLDNGMNGAYRNMLRHIQEMRPSLDFFKSNLLKENFEIINIVKKSFRMHFVDATSMINHFFIRFYFLKAWKTLLDDDERPLIMSQLEMALNKDAEMYGCIVLEIPYFCVNCNKE